MCTIVKINKFKTGRKINNLMLERNISVLRLQQMMGLETTQSIYKWLNGKSLPDLDHMATLCYIFDVPMDELLVKEYVEQDWF